MRIKIGLGILLFAATMVAASVVGNRPMTPANSKPPGLTRSAEVSPIEALDRSVQIIMHDDKGFGWARIVHALPQLHRYDPTSATDKDDLRALEESGWSVGLRLASRKLHESGPVDKALSPAIVITSRTPQDDGPRLDDLGKVGREALEQSDGAGDGVATGSVGRWSMEARVVRADRKACLDCHAARQGAGGDVHLKRPLRVGDALGVVVYYFRRDPR